MLSHLSHVPFYVTLWIVAHQVLLSIGFSRQEYWSGLSFSSPGNLPDPGIEPVPLTSNLHWHMSSLPLAPPDKPRQHIKKQRHHVANKSPDSKSYGFSSSHVWMWELDCKEGRVPKNWCFRIVMLEKTPESALDNKEIKPVNPKGNQPWIFIGRTDTEAEAPVVWPPDVKSQLVGKYPDTGKDCGQEEKGTTEERCLDGITDSVNGHEFEQTPGDSEGQGSLYKTSSGNSLVV